MAVQSKPVRPSAPSPRRRVTPGLPTGARRSNDAVESTVARQRSVPQRPAPPTILRPPSRAEASSRGDILLLVFFAATVIMVLAVMLVGGVGQMWVLVPVMLVDLIVTFAVIATLVSMLGGGSGLSA